MRRISPVHGLVLLLAACVLAAPPLARGAEPTLDPGLRSAIDAAAQEALASTGAPSASIAVVRDGRVAYLQAYGSARLDPPAPAATSMRYSIGSVSKQFTATAILMLAEEGKLSLDDPVGRFVPGLTRADAVTIRQILSHTSGYRDYWPQDYVPPFMLEPTTARAILDRWAKAPLDFAPGVQYQYSNTGYVLAGVIVEKVSGTALLPFLSERMFRPLGMTSVADVDRERLAETDPTGYLRYALGPPRPAPKEGKGWLFAAGELAMTAEDLARWNLGMIRQKLLRPESYRKMQTTVLLANGVGISYGLGIGVGRRGAHRVLSHDGEVSGFTSTNMVFPDDGIAVTVLVNQDAVDTEAIGGKIADLLLAGAPTAEARARRIVEGLQAGRLDRSELTANASSYFTDEAIKDFASSLTPLGAPTEIRQTHSGERGGMTLRLFEVKFPSKTLAIVERDLPDGKIEQFQVTAN
jgi:CubicO group peptidase (beta-lactamase class C family)